MEAAGILSRDANGDLITVDEYGLSYDFHGLRHTFATMLNQARVPLATAQRLMRHSDPKLTAKVYTHVMVDTKAEALDMLPTIAAVVTTEKDAATGTYDPAPESGKIIVMPVDSFGMDATANIKTYGDFYGALNAGELETSKHEKALSPKGKQGELIWRSRRDSNPQPPDRQSGALTNCAT